MTGDELRCSAIEFYDVLLFCVCVCVSRAVVLGRPTVTSLKRFSSGRFGWRGDPFGR